MTKVMSLSDKAYETLKSLKKSGESFSDVVIRITSKEKKKSLLEFAGTWKGDDADEILAEIMKDRERVQPREFGI
jgi:predicted CopG family antitoxin